MRHRNKKPIPKINRKIYNPAERRRGRWTYRVVKGKLIRSSKGKIWDGKKLPPIICCMPPYYE